MTRHRKQTFFNPRAQEAGAGRLGVQDQLSLHSTLITGQPGLIVRTYLPPRHLHITLLQSAYKDDVNILNMCMSALPEYVANMCNAQEGQKRTPESQELELQKDLSSHVGARNQTRSSTRVSNALIH